MKQNVIKIEFPADRKDIAQAIGRALLEIGGGTPDVASTVTVCTSLTPFVGGPSMGIERMPNLIVLALVKNLCGLPSLGDR